VGGRRHTIEQILQKLDRAQQSLADGQSMRVVCRELAVTEQTYYRWRKVYGVSRIELAERVRALERENAQLRRLVAEQVLKHSILSGGHGPHS
jgi:putative transposase